MVARLKDQEEIIFLNTQRVFFKKKHIYLSGNIYLQEMCFSLRQKEIHSSS